MCKYFLIKLQHLVKTNSQASKIDSKSELGLKIKEEYFLFKSVMNSENNNDPAQIFDNDLRIDATHYSAKRKSTDAVEGSANKTKR